MVTIEDPELEKLLNFLARQEEFVFLDTSRPDRENHQSLLFLDPVERLICRQGDDLEAYLGRLQRRLARGFHLAGWVGYEFGAQLEGKLESQKPQTLDGQLILADLGVFLKPYTFDHHSGENTFPWSEEEGEIPDGYTISQLRSNMTENEFIEALEKVRQYIIAGDTYQVNYTLKLLFNFAGSAEKLYLTLRRNQSVAYGAFLRHGRERILSFSPELFFRKKGAEITVRPMKGTAAKGRNGEEEARNMTTLHHDPKNRSENVMIVDLLRNDLARLMHGHGASRVRVESLFDVEAYESLLQMTSTIKASSDAATMAELQLTELFRALFPCGSITGAPKIRTMQIIDELEKDRRGVYTGAIGYFGPDGSAAFNVPIRTVHLEDDRGEMGIGAGITHDSVPAEEWRESLLKGRFLTHRQPDFQLIETLLWQPDGGYWLLEEHLARLFGGARFFRFQCEPQEVRRRLARQVEGFGPRCRRVRLTLAKDGRLHLTDLECEAPLRTRLAPVPPPGETPLPIDFSKRRIDADSPWAYHKTTVREIYDRQYAEAKDEGLFDCLFCNGAGEVTEGCITNLIVYLGGRYLTPPVACGLLPGVMRGHLLADPAVPLVEQVLGEEEVRAAEALYLCNSVRGLVRVRLR